MRWASFRAGQKDISARLSGLCLQLLGSFFSRDMGALNAAENGQVPLHPTDGADRPSTLVAYRGTVGDTSS
jgi:hypothetical protein